MSTAPTVPTDEPKLGAQQDTGTVTHSIDNAKILHLQHSSSVLTTNGFCVHSKFSFRHKILFKKQKQHWLLHRVTVTQVVEQKVAGLKPWLLQAACLGETQ